VCVGSNADKREGVWARTMVGKAMKSVLAVADAARLDAPTS